MSTATQTGLVIRAYGGYPPLMLRLLYKPVGLLLGIAAGHLAATVFRKSWRLAVRREGEPPDPTDESSPTREVLAAAALRGAVFALVKAAAQRGGALGYRRLTGVWPGRTGGQAERPG